ncbi:hypothetical protein QYF61_019250 [Mycteria americana]|uniref:Uncharacterized protein n=1 Tax=Mycteria americana TaxID=33587 RepID=A0AAN7RPH0_MYCAM|nr:hypothetical protein QYF61_019250 [Mycteria americana]
MSSNMAVATKERLASVRGTQMDFWDGMEHTFMMPSITAEERTAVWDAVAGYVQEQLLLHKGVRIPTLGSFDAVPKRIQVGAEVVTIRKPVFHLARNLALVHNLVDNKAYLPGNKELEPLKYAKVAAAASVSRCKVEGCIQGTTSLLSHCLGKGHNVALILKDIGLLLIEGTKVQMKFYYDFLQRLSGKQNLEKVIFKDMASRSGQARATALPTLTAWGSSSIEFLSHAEDVLPSLGSSITEFLSHAEDVLPSLGSSSIEFLSHVEDVLPSLGSSIIGVLHY